jgi:hypothetical protein
VPWILSSFFTMISPFLDPATRAKIVMLRSPEGVKDSIPLDMLDARFSGQWHYQFNSDKYWNSLIDFCGIASDGTRSHPSKARSQQGDEQSHKVEGVAEEPAPHSTTMASTPAPEVKAEEVA